MIPPRGIVISNYFPLVKVAGQLNFGPLQFVKVAWRMRSWSIRAVGNEEFELRHGETVLVLPQYYASMTLNEWKMWEDAYLPCGGLAGKVVLDVGAGAGETAYFYMSHGASKVICVEADKQAYAALLRNAERNKWPIEAVNEKFRLSHLDSFEHDYLKMDIDGGERALLDYQGNLGACMIEAHPYESGIPDIDRRLKEKFGLRDVLEFGSKGIRYYCLQPANQEDRT